MLIRLFLVAIFLSSVYGCASAPRKSESEHLQSRVVELEKKLEEKDSEIVDLQYQVKDISSKVDSKTTPPPSSFDMDVPMPVGSKASSDEVIRVNATALKVQTALKNAGYYPGKIDGKVGPGTKSAVIAFQRAQGLTADGVVGRRTWEALKQHLN